METKALDIPTYEITEFRYEQLRMHEVPDISVDNLENIILHTFSENRQRAKRSEFLDLTNSIFKDFQA
jgi:hypothetical protein